MPPFRVGLSAGLGSSDGSRVLPPLDTAPLDRDPRIEWAFLDGARTLTGSATRDLDAVLLMQEAVTAESFARPARTCLVARFGVGYDRIDLDACTSHGVLVANTPDGVRRPMAVGTLAYLLALATRMRDKDRIARDGPAGWSRLSEFLGTGLIGRTLGMVGMGRIGSEVFRLARPFGLRHIAHDPYASEAAARELDVTLVDLETVFREADFLTLHCPLTAATRGLVDARLLGLMKPTAFLINTSRGPVVNQKDLYEALAARRIAGAALDVLETEPPAADDPILALDNALFAPHGLVNTDQCMADCWASDIGAIRAVAGGHVPENVVNRDVLDSPDFQAKLKARAAG